MKKHLKKAIKATESHNSQIVALTLSVLALFGSMTQSAPNTQNIDLKRQHFSREAIADMLKETPESLHPASIKLEEEKVIFDKNALKKREMPENVRSIYLTASSVSSKNFDNMIDQLIKSGGNAVVMDIEHGGGKLAFEPKNEWLKSVNPGSPTLNNMAEIVEELHKKGLYVIARQVIFNDPYTAARKPEWRIKNKWGGGLFDGRWLDPSMPSAQRMNLLILEEVADFGFDEVQFDYIRFPTTNHSLREYHYDEENFTRTEVIADFLRKAKDVANEKGVFLGADVFGAAVWGDVDWKILGQHIPTLGKIVDVIYPMTYPSHYSDGFYGHYNFHAAPYSIIYNSIDRFVEQAGDAQVRPWIQGFNLKSPTFGDAYVATQIEASYDAGATGFAIWNASNSYSYSWSSMDLEPEKVTAVAGGDPTPSVENPTLKGAAPDEL